MPSSPIEFLIVGQGLAGSILAMKLLQLGREVMVIDNDHSGSSSKVAAGIINPITGHRLNISEDFFKHLPYAEDFYSELEDKLGVQLFRPIAQQRLIKNAGQQQYLRQRLDEEQYQGLIEVCKDSSFKNSEFGAITVSKTAIVDVPKLLIEVQNHLAKQGCFRKQAIEYSNLEFSPLIRYQDIKAEKVVFCEGYQAIHNPLLADLPFKLAKGEVLTVTKPNFIGEQMLSWGNWLVPNGDSAKLGSNYVWNDISADCDAATKDKLLESLKQVNGHIVKCIKHESGIRPTTKHRVPFVGAISTVQNAYCFNGFGSKGCLTMPYFADLLIANLLHNTSLPPELVKWL